MEATRNETKQLPQESLDSSSRKISQAFAPQWIAAIRALVDFEQKGGSHEADPRYVFQQTQVLKETESVISPLLPSHKNLGFREALEVCGTVGRGRSVSIPLDSSPPVSMDLEIRSYRGNPFFEAVVTFKGYSTKMHSSDEARLAWWNRSLTKLDALELTGRHVCLVWGSSSILMAEDGRTLLPQKMFQKMLTYREALPESPFNVLNTLIRLDKAEPQTLETLARESREVLLKGYPKIPTNNFSNQLYNLFFGTTSQVFKVITELISSEMELKDGKLEPKYAEFYCSMLSDDPDFKAFVKAESSLFQTDHQLEGASEFNRYIKKTFGHFGIQVLGAVLTALDDQFAYYDNDRSAVLDLPELLKNMGYKRGENGAYKTDDLVKVGKVLDCILSINFEFRFKLQNSDKYDWQKWKAFTVVAEMGETSKRTTRVRLNKNGKTQLEDRFVSRRKSLRVRATEIWYRESFYPPNGLAPQFTRVKKELFALPKKHSISTLLGVNFALAWRRNPEKPFITRTVGNLFKTAGLKTSGRNLGRDNKKLVEEFKFMKDEDFVGDYVRMPSKDGNFLEDVMHIYPPEPTRELNEGIAANRIRLLEGKKSEEKEKALTLRELSKINEKSGLSANKFAKEIGISPGHFSKIKKGEKTITLEFSQKVRERFPSKASG